MHPKPPWHAWACGHKISMPRPWAERPEGLTRESPDPGAQVPNREGTQVRILPAGDAMELHRAGDRPGPGPTRSRGAATPPAPCDDQSAATANRVVSTSTGCEAQKAARGGPTTDRIPCCRRANMPRPLPPCSWKRTAITRSSARGSGACPASPMPSGPAPRTTCSHGFAAGESACARTHLTSALRVRSRDPGQWLAWLGEVDRHLGLAVDVEDERRAQLAVLPVEHIGIALE